jgi:hypothetical protein
MAVKSLLIAVPTTGGIMKSRTVTSLMKLGKALARNGIDYHFWNVDASDVVTVRNRYANTLLASPQYDALLFVDSDMEFTPRVVLKMIGHGSDVVAAAYKKKLFDLDAFAQAMAKHGDLDKAISRNGAFTVLASWEAKKGKPLKVRNGFLSAAGAGMGMCLITRKALEDMVSEGAVDELHGVLEDRKYSYYGFFNHMDYKGNLLLEDYSFCCRWTQMMKRELPVCIDEEIGHVGEFVYSGTYLDTLQLKKD